MNKSIEATNTISFLDDLMRVEYSYPSIDDNYMNFSSYQMVGRLIAAKPWITNENKKAEWINLLALCDYQIMSAYGQELKFIAWLNIQNHHEYPCKTEAEDSYYRYRFCKEVLGWS